MCRARLWLSLPPVAMCLLDLSMTLWGQPPEYRAGYHTIREGNPLAASLLLIHPAAFLAVGAAWIALVMCLVAAMPRLPALTTSVAITQAHTWAAGGWVPILLPQPFAFLAALFVVSALLTVFACERSGGENGSRVNRT